MDEQGESVADVFARYQQTVTGAMRIELAAKNLEILHDVSRPLRVLDAGGGNGLNTSWLLERGHDVTLMDPDPDMLEQARRRVDEHGLGGRCTLVHGTIGDAAEILPGAQFDLIVCHHVLEYVTDPQRAIGELHQLAAPDGELSLVTLNPVSEVIRAMVFRKDGALGLTRLTDLAYDAQWFGAASLFDADQITEWAAREGWALKDFRAVRVLADYVSEDEYSEEKAREVVALEEALAGREPYRRIGRYLQFGFKNDRSAGGGAARAGSD